MPYWVRENPRQLVATLFQLCAITSWVSGSRSSWGRERSRMSGDDIEDVENLNIAFQAEVPREPSLQTHVLEHRGCWLVGEQGEGPCLLGLTATPVRAV